jgi:hypothetical protein
VVTGNRSNGVRTSEGVGSGSASLFVSSGLAFAPSFQEHLLKLGTILSQVVQQARQPRMLFKAGRTWERFSGESHR